MSEPAPVQLSVSLDHGEAWALAQLCKRFTWEDAVRLSNAHDGGAERDRLLEAVCRVGRSLDKHGISPR